MARGGLLQGVLGGGGEARQLGEAVAGAGTFELVDGALELDIVAGGELGEQRFDASRETPDEGSNGLAEGVGGRGTWLRGRRRFFEPTEVGVDDGEEAVLVDRLGEVVRAAGGEALLAV